MPKMHQSLIRLRRRLGLSERLYYLLNTILFVLLLGTFTLFNLLANHNPSNVMFQKSVSDHNFESDSDYAVEVFDFMHKHRTGKIPLKSMVAAEEPILTHSCWIRYPTRPAAETILKLTSDWQSFLDPNLNLEAYLYNAYLDKRPNELYPKSAGSVQILAMVHRALTVPVYCQFWSSDTSTEKPTLIVTAHTTEIWQRAWDPRNRFYLPILITCGLPNSSKSPIKDHQSIHSVSLSTSACSQSTNRLPINGISHINQPYHLPESNEKVVVCIKGMDFQEDNSLRLVEWIEAQRLMGADQIMLYTYALHPQTGKVLRYYDQMGLLKHIAINLPGNQPNEPYQRSRFIWRNRQQKRRNELIPYNDCILRHLHTHRYALLVDTDELVVPLIARNWQQMLAAERNGRTNLSSLSITNMFKFDGLTKTVNATIPDYMHMLQHNMRSTQLSAPANYGKSFMYLPNILTVFNHYPMHKLTSDVRKTSFVSPKTAVKLHYKEKCPIESTEECPMLFANTKVDHSLDRFSEQLIENVKKVVMELRLK